MTGELRTALERVLRRARGVEERAAAREVRRLLESLDLFTRGGVATVTAPAPDVTVPKPARRTTTLHGPRNESAARNMFVRALTVCGLTLPQIQALTFGAVTSIGAQFVLRLNDESQVVLVHEDAQMVRDLLRWGWGAAIDGGAKPDLSWPLVPAKPGATSPPTLRQLQHAVALKPARNKAPAAA
jgi:hypothetical protein